MTTSGFVDGAYERAAFISVRDRMAATEATKPEAVKPLTPEQQAADYYYALHLQREAEKKAKEKAVEQAKLQRRTERAALNTLRLKLIAECGLSPSDAERVARELRRKL